MLECSSARPSIRTSRWTASRHARGAQDRRYTGIEHDAAIVFAARPFVLVILTRGLTKPGEAATLMAEINPSLLRRQPGTPGPNGDDDRTRRGCWPKSSLGRIRQAERVTHVLELGGHVDLSTRASRIFINLGLRACRKAICSQHLSTLSLTKRLRAPHTRAHRRSLGLLARREFERHAQVPIRCVRGSSPRTGAAVPSSIRSPAAVENFFRSGSSRRSERFEGRRGKSLR